MADFTPNQVGGMSVNPNSRPTTGAKATVHSTHGVSGGKSVLEWALATGNPEPSKYPYGDASTPETSLLPTDC
jgi:hypothetical protein